MGNTFLKNEIRYLEKREKELLKENEKLEAKVEHLTDLNEIQSLTFKRELRRAKQARQFTVDEIRELSVKYEDKRMRCQELEAGELLALDKLRERIDHLELIMIDREATIAELETELSKRRVEISLLELRLKPLSGWPKGVIAVDVDRPVEPCEEGIYFVWWQNKIDNFPMVVFKKRGSHFRADYIYQKSTNHEIPPQPKKV